MSSGSRRQGQPDPHVKLYCESTNMPKITIQPLNRTIEAQEGETIMEAAWADGLYWPTTCGGQGICTSCASMVQEVPSGAGVALTEEWLGGRPLWENLLGLVLVWLWPIIWVGSQRSRHGELRRIKERVESGPASWTAGHPLGVGVQHYERGLDLGDEAKWREAVWEFDRAIDLNPKHANAYAQRGFAYAELGDSQRAVADMEKATSLTRDPNIIAGLKAAIDKLRGDG